MSRKVDRVEGLGWPLLLILGFSILVLAFGAHQYYGHELASLEALAFHNMNDDADYVVRQVASWRNERIGDGRILSSQVVGNATSRLLESPDSPEAQEILGNLLQTVMASYAYSGASLVDKAGRIRLHVGSVPDNPKRSRLLIESSHGAVTLSDLYIESTIDKPWMSLTVPLHDGYAFILEIDPNVFLYPYLMSRWQNSKTGETYVSRVEDNFQRNVIISPMRWRPNAAGRWTRSIKNFAIPHERAPYEKGYVTKGTDYRNQAALFVMRAIPGTDWYVVSKIDESEITTALSQRRLEIAMIVVLACSANGGLAYLFWKNRQMQYYRVRRDWFRRIASDTPTQIWTVGATGDVTFLNEQLLQFLGSDQADGGSIEHFLEYFHPDDREQARARLAESLSSRTESRDEFRVRRYDGQYRLFAMHSRPRYDPDGTFTGLAGSSVDITEQRAAEDALREANAVIGRELQERTRSQQEVLALSARLISAQEEERTRVARELHDDLCQQIAAATMAISLLKKKIGPDSTEAVEMTMRLRDKLLGLADSVRRLSHELHPSALEHSGLEEALKAYCRELTAIGGHKVSLQIRGQFGSLSPMAKLCIYRIAQEALRNSARHSGVDAAEVVLSNAEGSISLVIADRGVGVSLQTGSGLGLVSMRERSRLAGGTINIDSAPGQGFRVVVKIPVVPEVRADFPALT